MVPKNPEIKHIIKTKEDLKNKLGLWVNINIPEFKQTLEFTQSELDELKESIIKKPENEIFAILEEKIKEKTSLSIKAQWEAVTDKAWLKIDILKWSLDKAKNPSFGYSESINSLNLTKSLESQKNIVESIWAWVIILIPELSKFNLIEKWGFASMEDLAKINIAEVKNKLSPTSYSLLNKLIEISTWNWEVSEYFKSNWQNLQSRWLEISATATSFMDKLDKKDYKLDKKESEWVLWWMQENKWKTWIWLAWWAILGYWAIKLIGGLFGGWDSKDGEKDWVTDWIFDKMWLWKYGWFLKKFWILWILAAVAIWAFMWKDKLWEYWDKISDFLGFENKEEKEAFAKFAEKISGSDDKVKIKPETINKIKWEKVNDFISPARSLFDNAKNFFSKWAGKWAEAAGVWEVAKMAWIEEKDLSEMEAIQKYLKTRIESGEIKVNDKTTIWDLAKLDSWNEKLAKEVESSHMAEIWAVATGATLNSKVDKAEENWEVYTWYKPAILWARAYQFYHWAYKPYNWLNTNEKNIFKWSLRNFFWRKEANFSYENAKSNLSNLENELEVFKTQDLDERTNILKQEFESWNWTHSKYWNIDEVLKNPNHEVKKALWYDGKILKPLTPESSEFALKYYKYLAEQENFIWSKLVQEEIRAIKSWPEAYKKFTLLVNNPEKFAEKLREMEITRGEYYKKMTWTNSVEAIEWKKFISMWSELKNTIDEKNMVIWKMSSEISELSKEFNSKSTSAIRKKEVEQLIRNKLVDIKWLEDSTRKLVNNFMTQNEKQMVNILDNTNKKTLKHKIFWFWDNFKWDTKAKDLFDLNLVSPEKRFLRFSLSWSGNKLILLWIWAWTLLSAWDWDKKELNKVHLIHTAKRVAWWLTPVYGTYLDAWDMVRSFSSWDTLWGFANMWAMMASWAWDVLLAMSFIPWFAPFWIWGKWALSALRWYIKSWVAVKSISEASEVAKTWKIVMWLENWVWKIVWQEVIEMERISQKILEWAENVWSLWKERITKVLKYWLVWWTVMSLWLWAWVPLASYALNKTWMIEEEKVENN